MTTNIARVRLTQTTQELAEPLEIGQSVVFQGTGSVISQTTTDNHDQTMNVVCTVKANFLEMQKADHTPASKGLITEKSIRSACYAVATRLGESPEGLYHIVKERALQFLDRYKKERIVLG